MTHPGVPVRLRQLLAVLGFLVLSFGAQVALAAPAPTPPPGQATPTPAPPASMPANAPANAQGGVDTLVQPPPIQGQSQPLLFEQYGPLDYSGLTTSVGVGDLNVINDEGNGEAMAEATGMYLLGIVSARIVEWCFSLNLVSDLGPTINQFSVGLENGLYGSYHPLLLVLAAIVVGWTLLVMRKFLGGVVGILWAALTITLAAQLFVSPASLLAAADQFATGATNAVVVGVAQEDPGAPPGSYEQAGGDANYEVRLLANRLWMVSVYDPWTMIEFGTVDPTVKNGDHLGIQLLRKNDGLSNSYDQDIQAAPQWIQQWAQGNWGVPRAMFGLFLVALGGILLVFTLLIALTVIVGTLTAIVLGCLTVPVWLLAPIPGFGQRLVVSWFGGIVAGLAVSTAGALYLVLVLVLLGAVQQLEGSVGLITVGVLDVGLIVVALWMRKSFFRLGKHVVRLPVNAVAGRPLVAPARDGRSVSAGVVVSRHTDHDRQRVAAPSARTARWARGAGGRVPAAGAGTTAARAGAAGGSTTTMSTAAGTTVSAATAGTALLAIAAVRAGQRVGHVHDGARRRVQGVVENTVPALPPPRSPEHHNGRPQQLPLPGRVSQSGVRSFRGTRVDPPAGSHPAGDGAHGSQSAAHRPAGPSQKARRRRVRTLRS